MASPANQRMFCSCCSKAYQHARFKTCDQCRKKTLSTGAGHARQSSKTVSTITVISFLLTTATIALANIDKASEHVLRPASPIETPQQNGLSVTTPVSAKRAHNPSPLRPATKRQKTTDLKRAQDGLLQALNFLRDGHRSRAVASDLFPPEISATDIRASVARFEDNIAAAASTGVCASCGKIIPLSDLYQMEDDSPLLQPLNGTLDNCGRRQNSNTCSPCHSALSRNAIPKFSAKNLVNVMQCQHYPSALEGLTPVEECLIARSHPLGVILKLRPNGRSSPVNYRALYGHFIVIPQDPGPLLDILPSPELRLHDLIKVFWLGNKSPVDKDLKPFLLVRKAKVLAALRYLVKHNHLYRDVTINHSIIDDWNDDFIPRGLRDSIVCLDEPDHHEREGYTVDLQTGNYENDLQAAQDIRADSTDTAPLTTGSVSTDINGERQDPDMRTLNTLFDIVSTRITSPTEHLAARDKVENRQKLPSISYAIHGKTSLLNHWVDPSYFTSAFPTLFPTGIGGHLEKRPAPVSLVAFAEWSLKAP
jgi:hypothetical protein